MRPAGRPPKALPSGYSADHRHRLPCAPAPACPPRTPPALQRGALGLLVLPLASLLEMSARMADSIRRAVAGASSLGWARPPRFVSPSEPLTPYDRAEALGCWLLTELETRAAQHLPAAGSGDQYGKFVLCVPAEQHG